MGGQPVKRDLEGLSIVTLNTPHRGSVLAQYGVEARQLTAAAGGPRPGSTRSPPSRRKAPTTATSRRRGRPRSSRPTRCRAGPRGASVATDADRDGNRSSRAPEARGFPGASSLADRLYRLIGNVARRDVSRSRRCSPALDRITITETPTAAFLTNDAVVTQNSAGLYSTYRITGWHHINVHSTLNAETIARDAQTPGLVDWRAR